MRAVLTRGCCGLPWRLLQAGINQGLTDGYVHLGVRAVFDPSNPNQHGLCSQAHCIRHALPLVASADHSPWCTCVSLYSSCAVIGFYGGDDLHSGSTNLWSTSDIAWHHCVVTVTAPASGKHTRSLYFDNLMLVTGLSSGQLQLPGNTTFSIGGDPNIGTWRGDMSGTRANKLRAQSTALAR